MTRWIKLIAGGVGALLAAALLMAQAPINLNQGAGQGNLNVPGIPEQQFGPNLAPFANFRNLLIGGDFAANPWQRGWVFSNITTSAVYTADRFFAYTATPGRMQVTRETTSPPTRTSAYMRVGRVTGDVNLGQLCIAQVLETSRAKALASRTTAFSFKAQKGSGLSSTSSRILVNVSYGTGTDQGSASFVAGTWTGQANALNLLQPITATWTTYAFTAPIPSTATEVAIKLCYTPIGTAGNTDYVNLADIQYEDAPTLSPFERRSMATEQALAERYAVWMAEAPLDVAVATGQAISTTSCKWQMPLTVTLRTTPTVRVTNGTWRASMASGGGVNLTSLASFGGAAGQTLRSVTMIGTISFASLTQGNGCQLQGGSGGTGVVLVDAEL